MRRGLRMVMMMVLLLAALVVLGFVGSMIKQIITPDNVHGMDQFIDRIWWPASAGRLVIYVLLAWLVFPLVVRRRAQLILIQLDKLATTGEESSAERPVWQARLQHLHRVGRRTHWVFLALLASDLVMAQFPYWLLRG